MADDLKRAVVWKSLLIDGRDYRGLWHTAEGWLLKGTVVGVLKDQRPMTRPTVSCGSADGVAGSSAA